MTDATVRRVSSLDRAMWLGALTLSLIGVTAAVYRTAHVANAGEFAEPLRTRALAALGVADPRATARAAEVRALDASFAAHPWLTRIHVLCGGLFLLFAPLQFWARLRDGRPAVHRWSGRVLLVALALSTLPALYFGLWTPFAGGPETMVIAIVGALLLSAATQGYLAICRGEVARHRQWMIRVFALTAGIAMVRLAALVIDVAMLPFGISVTTVFLASLWVGWGVSIAGAEWWIARTRVT
jgi:hypothetical protein